MLEPAVLTAGLNDLEGHLQPNNFMNLCSLQLRMKGTRLCEICFYFVNVLHMSMSKETRANSAVRHCTLSCTGNAVALLPLQELTSTL